MTQKEKIQSSVKFAMRVKSLSNMKLLAEKVQEVMLEAGIWKNICKDW